MTHPRVLTSTEAIAYFVKEKTGSSSFLPHIAIPTTLSAVSAASPGQSREPLLKDLLCSTDDQAEFTMNAGYSNEKGDKVGVSSK